MGREGKEGEKEIEEIIRPEASCSWTKGDGEMWRTGGEDEFSGSDSKDKENRNMSISGRNTVIET